MDNDQVVLDEKSAEGLVERIVNRLKPKEVPKVEAPITPTPPIVPAPPVAGKLTGLSDDEVAALSDVFDEQITRRMEEAAKKQEPPKAPEPAKTEPPKEVVPPPPPPTGKGIVEGQGEQELASADAKLKEDILAEMREKPIESLAEFLRFNLERKKAR